MIKDEIKKRLEVFFKANANDYFIGGSERFNFTKTDKSDIDFFVLSKDEMFMDHPEIQKLLPIKYKQNILPYEPDTTQYSLLGGLIHITIFCNQTDFTNLKNKHNEIEKLLEKLPSLHYLVNYLRFGLKIKGAEIFRILKTLTY